MKPKYKFDSEPQICRLCLLNPPIQNSHAIPKFTLRWIKKTSLPGGFRRGIFPNERLQDTDKHPLLCVKCETIFGRFENIFCNRIFIPYIEERETNFEYEEWLLKFVCSLAWRTTIIHSSEVKNQIEAFELKLYSDALESWRLYLLGESSDPGPHSHHLFFLKKLTGEMSSDSAMLNHHGSRGVDATLSERKNTFFKEIYSYTHMPGMIFWTGIYPHEVTDWHGTKIFDKGNINISQSMSMEGFKDFYYSRVLLVTGGQRNMSQKQKQAIEAKIQETLRRRQDKKDE